ncbi:MAG: flagellar basal body P-ring formation chaperone FlgA [Proteobacteria bacterium]|nr:flagellar basal body P-ring formation chaperone FlgA [Pseudomonadota bacterium]MBU1687476.1 flagellar basal body P-ring formation chaperone FlgA [Pseudomonadota bacterium]
MPCVTLGASGGGTWDQQALAGVFREKLLDRMPWEGTEVEIENFNSQPAELLLPAGVIVFEIVQGESGFKPGRKLLVIAAKVNGQEVARVRMWGDLHLYGQVVCAGRQLSRGDLLTAADVILVRSDLSRLGANVVRRGEEAVGKRLSVGLGPGALVYDRFLEEPPLVERGDLVTIVARNEHLSLSVPGRLREEGTLGDLVRVKNLISRKELLARVEDERTVVVSMDGQL